MAEVSKKIKNFLESQGVKYEITQHPVAYTASEVAGSEHIPGKRMIKSVIIKSKEKFIMCVLPAIHLVDFEKLQKVTQEEDLKLAEEEEIAKLFPEYEIGAEPPFGQLYGLDVYADSALDEDSEIAFNAGTHTDVVHINFQDFKRVVKPIIADIGTHI